MKKENVYEWIGKKINMITIIDIYAGGNYQNKCKVRCECGKEMEKYLSNVKKGYPRACEECKKKLSKYKGLSDHPLHNKWHQIKSRCQNSKHKSWYLYGERGISVCDERDNDFISFYNRCLDNGWYKGCNLDLDRIDSDGNYEPSNCRFISHKENIRNRRFCIRPNAFGLDLTIAEWERLIGVGKNNFRENYKVNKKRGYSDEEILYNFCDKRNINILLKCSEYKSL